MLKKVKGEKSERGNRRKGSPGSEGTSLVCVPSSQGGKERRVSRPFEINKKRESRRSEKEKAKEDRTKGGDDREHDTNAGREAASNILRAAIRKPTADGQSPAVQRGCCLPPVADTASSTIVAVTLALPPLFLSLSSFFLSFFLSFLFCLFIHFSPFFSTARRMSAHCARRSPFIYVSETF